MAEAKVHKIDVAARLFLAAHERFTEATGDDDYIVTIVLSGASVGIVAPLLEEQGGNSTHSILAMLSKFVSHPGEPSTREGMFRAVYNGLKHAGDKKRNLKPSNDMEIVADLRLEAAHMLEAALFDFRETDIPQSVRAILPEGFIRILEHGGDYA